MSISDHPLRNIVLSELHARPLVLIPATCRLRRLVILFPSSPGMVASIVQRLTEFIGSEGGQLPGGRQFSFEAGKRSVTWEVHTEFATVTWRTDLLDWEAQPEDIGIELVSGGEIIGATRLDVTEESEVPIKLLEGFRLHSLCCSGIDGGKAQLATDYVPDEHGFIRVEMAAGALNQVRRSIMARRLLEIETYRTVALLGLPLAQEMTPSLRSAEIELAAILTELEGPQSTRTATETLERLRNLSARTGRLLEQSSYRFAACAAYGEILRRRLNDLDEIGTRLGHILSRFIRKRVDPALATCRATERRLAQLSKKIEDAIHLLDVHIGLQIQTQTASVLDKIARTAHSQFLLQRTVEGLSTVAISYYCLGILGYFLTGASHWLHFDKSIAVTIATPIILLATWVLVRNIRKKHSAPQLSP